MFHFFAALLDPNIDVIEATNKRLREEEEREAELQLEAEQYINKHGIDVEFDSNGNLCLL
jgi:regulator of protease activity HflC (stomatin/prohibitin superfamily)